MNEEVTQYIEKTQPWQKEVCNSLREIMFTAIPDVEERLQYGKPHYLKNGSYTAVMYAGKDKVSFMLFNATNIPEVKGFLRSMGKGDRKTIDIQEDQSVDYQQVTELVRKVNQA